MFPGLTQRIRLIRLNFCHAFVMFRNLIYGKKGRATITKGLRVRC